MSKSLPPRPNLEHLRSQAKSLLSALEAGDADAFETMRKHLPAAEKLSKAQLRAASFRLADAQSAIARKTGFASWPQLTRHVEQLRSLEGTWEFASLEIAGTTMPAAALAASRLLIDGDRFRTESPEAIYEGVFNIDVESTPHGIDIEFVEGPEAGNWNYGIFRLNGDTLEICLDTAGKARPTDFRTQPGTSHALETLRRSSCTQPDSVTGGIRRARQTQVSQDQCAQFEYVPCPTLDQIQGEWGAVKLSINGQELPSTMCKTGHRSLVRNELKITFGGQLMIHALIRVNEAANPVELDYYNLAGAAPGTIQHGCLRWDGDEVCFCMGAPGQARPTDFDCSAGSGRTLSQWRRQT